MGDVVKLLRALATGEVYKANKHGIIFTAAADEIERLEAEVGRLKALINTPITDDWLEGVRIEAAHQQERWGAEHDAGKTPADWFWLLGYLGGKALSSAMVGNIAKAQHHTISSGAALLNWWRALDGDPAAKMRPGIDLSKSRTPPRQGPPARSATPPHLT